MALSASARKHPRRPCSLISRSKPAELEDKRESTAHSFSHKILFASTRHNERRPVRKVRSLIEQYEAHHGPSVATSRCVVVSVKRSDLPARCPTTLKWINERRYGEQGLETKSVLSSDTAVHRY